jgi:NAD(P)-dependent dehydrogenase (short-subunit alcohol dehydrogenase family)
MAVKLKPLAEQVIVLTGASSGIGLCTAQLAAQQGARVVLIASSTRVLEALVSTIGASGGEAICIAADVAVRGEVVAAARGAAAHFGHIDTWVNNAGVSIYGRLDQVSEAESRRVFDVNFWGVVNGSLAALPYLLGGGALINMGSDLPDRDLPLQGMYASSKHAVEGFTQALRAEVVDVDHAPISITLIHPGATVVPASSYEHEAGYLQHKAARVPDPMRVAEAILRAATGDALEVRVAQRRWPRAARGIAA